jgi:hypothetical protein
MPLNTINKNTDAKEPDNVSTGNNCNASLNICSFDLGKSLESIGK